MLVCCRSGVSAISVYALHVCAPAWELQGTTCLGPMRVLCLMGSGNVGDALLFLAVELTHRSRVLVLGIDLHGVGGMVPVGRLDWIGASGVVEQ